MMQTVGLSSSDGRFGVSVAADDVELIASMLVLLEISRGAAVHHITALNRDEPRPPIALAS